MKYQIFNDGFLGVVNTNLPICNHRCHVVTLETSGLVVTVIVHTPSGVMEHSNILN